MPLPTVISDISPIVGTGAAPNAGQPGGGENPSTFDDYLRLYAAFIAQLRAGGGLAASGANRVPFFDGAGALTSAADFVRDGSGNVGIGTATPISYGGGFVTFGVNGSSAGVLDLMSGGASQMRLFGNAVENRIQGITNVPLTVFTNNTERMRIDAAGNVGVGTASPLARLDINGFARIRAGNQLQFFNADNTSGASIQNSGAPTADALTFSTTGTERARIDASGHQINTPGNTTPPTLTVNGQFNLTPTSNTNLRISYRGTDGVTRVGNITLA